MSGHPEVQRFDCDAAKAVMQAAIGKYPIGSHSYRHIQEIAEHLDFECTTPRGYGLTCSCHQPA